MLIRVICPRCERVFQVDSDLVGRKMLCPNKMCGDIFEVQPAPGSEQPPLPEGVDLVPMAGEESRSDAPASPTAQSGNVGDMVPILPAEGMSVPMAEPVGPTEHNVPTLTAQLDQTPPSESAPKTADWRQAPPPPSPSQRSAGAAQANDHGTSRGKRASKRKRVAPDTVKLTPPGPTELPPGSWEPPPVRGGPVTDGQATEVAPEEPSHAEPAPPASEDDLEKQFAEAARRRRRRRLVVGGTLLAGIATVIAALVIFLPGVFGTGEAERARLAQAAYNDGRFADAFQMFTDLVQNYPDSEQHADYEFMAGLSDVRQHLPNVNPDIPGASEALRQLVVGHEKDQHVAEHAPDIWAATQRIISHYTEAAKTALADKHADL
ncbi:MAG TPA: hypothetical protein VFA18_02750, partial [Gemmataceae bacterium]|nr:hypothetical protein [Gemmataceae bacterium]